MKKHFELLNAGDSLTAWLFAIIMLHQITASAGESNRCQSVKDPDQRPVLLFYHMSTSFLCLHW